MRLVQQQKGAYQRQLHFHRRQKGLDARNVHDAGQIVGEHMSRHLAGDARKRLHEETGRAHARLDDAEGMFDRFAPHAHAVVLMPLGPESTPWHLMGWGMHLMTGNRALSGRWIALWRRQWRWFGLAPIGLALAAIFASARPDLFIARGGQSMAVRGSVCLLVLPGGKLDEYTAEQ